MLTNIDLFLMQAMIAETVGDDDAMDLFRHTTELSPHVCIFKSH